MKSDLDLQHCVSDQFFPSVREAISTILKETCVSVVDTPRRELTRRCGIALVWFLASVLLAVEIPDIGTVPTLPFFVSVGSVRFGPNVVQVLLSKMAWFRMLPLRKNQRKFLTKQRMYLCH
jgi:hypothetical protein